MPEDEKTEEASQKRIDQAREKGDVPKSRELNSAIALLLGLLTLRFFAQFSLGGLKDISVYAFSRAPPALNRTRAVLVPAAAQC